MWTYKHEFGVIFVETWGRPFLVITENKYFDGDHHAYTYYRLGEQYDKLELAKFHAKDLNKKYDLPRIFNSAQSQDFLLHLQKEFIDAEIAA